MSGGKGRRVARAVGLVLLLPAAWCCSSADQREGLPALESGLAALHLGHYQQAHDYCSLAVAIRRDDDNAAACLLVAALYLGHYRQALSVVEGLDTQGGWGPLLSLELKGRLSSDKIPVSAPYPAHLAWACWWGHCGFEKEQVTSSDHRDPAHAVDVALSLYRSGAVDSALQVLHRWPADGAAMELSALLKIRSGDLAGAAAIYEAPGGRSLGSTSSFLSFLNPAGRATVEASRELTLAEEALRAASKHRSSPAHQLSAASHLIRAGRSAEALRYIERAGEAAGDSRMVVLFRLFTALLAEDRELSRSLSLYLQDRVPTAWKGWILRLSAAL
jgi:tetratricopeptide (TPR) repeat protein